MNPIASSRTSTNRIAVTTESITKLHRWAEADKEFLRLIIINNKNNEEEEEESSSVLKKLVYENYDHDYNYYTNCRQRYLRSYTFTKQKQSAAQRAKNWFLEKHNFIIKYVVCCR